MIGDDVDGVPVFEDEYTDMAVEMRVSEHRQLYFTTDSELFHWSLDDAHGWTCTCRGRRLLSTWTAEYPSASARKRAYLAYLMNKKNQRQ